MSVTGRVAPRAGQHPALAAGSVLVAVGVDGQLAGHLIMADPLREGAQGMLSGLRGQGIKRILLATGDRREVAERVTQGLPLDGIRAGLTPDQKVLLVLTEHKRGPVLRRLRPSWRRAFREFIRNEATRRQGRRAASGPKDL